MAKVIGPLNSSEARGKIGGLIYNTWRGISYVKTFTSPAQPRSSKVLALRALMIRNVRAWAALGATNQANWNAYATDHLLLDWTGVSKRITGANWYTALNTRLLHIAKTVSSSPPSVAAPDAVSDLTATPAANIVTLAWTATAGTGMSVIVYVFGPHSKGLAPKFEKASYWSVYEGESATAALSFTEIGRYTIWVFTCDESNGLISPALSISADVATLV